MFSSEDETDVDEKEVNENNKFSLPSDYISKPTTSDNCTVPFDILSFQYSYGYRCKKKYNLSVVGGSTLIYIAGNIMTFIDIQSKRISFRRSAIGGGLGFICSNTTSPHFAVGENGSYPPIIVYQWPSIEVVAVLRSGTKKAFTYLSFSHDGSMLCSQGSEPDFFITIWNWKEEKIILQYKSYGQEVSKCIFSQYNSNILISVGNGHIKFWKIVKTFTGLKLEGELGKFDKTTPTDIIGLLPMPQGMFLTGCEWGNMLLWSGNTIKYEISKRSPKTCHIGAITNIFYDDASDRLLTLGMDGCMKVWSYGPIHKTEMSEEMHTIGCLPIDEYEMKMPSAFLSAVKQFPNDSTDESWIVQDAKGAIWRMTLSVKNECYAEECLFRAPAGKIVGLSCSPIGCAFAVLSEDGGLYIYDYIQKILLGYKLFSERGTSLMWIPLKIDARGNKLLLGFQSGVIRLISISFVRNNEKYSDVSEMQAKESESSYEEEAGSSGGRSEDKITSNIKGFRSKTQSFWGQRRKRSSLKVAESMKFLDDKVKEAHTEAGEIEFALQQLLKPHMKSVSVISHNLNFNLFVTASEDGTVFFYDILRKDKVINLNPIGFVQIGNSITCLDWMPDVTETLLVCCSRGQVTEVIFSRNGLKTKNSSYELNILKKDYSFKSIKSQILRDIYLKQKEIEKLKKRERKEKELEIMREKHGRLDVDPEIYLADSEEEEELDPLYIPEIPNEILFGYYTESGNVKLSVGGYDCGYIYEYNFDAEEAVSWSTIQGIEDVEASCYIFSPDKKYLILGMDDGKIMVIKLKAEASTDLSDYWILPMHDGAVRKFSFSSDHQLLFSCGDDGNIFSYSFNKLKGAPLSKDLKSTSFLTHSSHVIPVRDVLDGERMLSLEEVKQQEKQVKEMKINDAQKTLVLNDIKNLQKRFDIILKRNLNLPPSQQFSNEEFELHPDLTKIIISMINEKAELLHRKHDWNMKKSKLALDKIADYFINCLDTQTPTVSSLRNDVLIEGYRLRKLSERFYEAKETALKKLKEQSLKFRPVEEEAISARLAPKGQQTLATFETIMNSLIPLGNVDLSKMRVQVMRTMEKYIKSRQKMDKRNAEWDALFSSKPSDKNNDKMDIKAIEKAKQTIGDYSLKTSPNYRVPPHLRMTTVEKYHQLLQAHLMIQKNKQEFNGKITNLAKKKTSLAVYLKRLLSEFEILKKENLSGYELLTNSNNMTKTTGGDASELDDSLTYKYHKLKKSLEEEIDWLVEPGISTPVNDLSHSMKSLEETELNTRMTPWEAEIAAIRRERALYNISVMQKIVAEEMTSFDRDIASLSNTKSELDLQLKYQENFIITLQEELLIIRKFEAQEEILTEKVQDKLLEKNKVIEKIHDIEGKIEMRKQNADDLLDQQNEIIANFQAAIANSTTASILQKIFKKKYKPIKIKSESDSSGEESSSSESSTDTSAEDDEFVLPVKLDENVCPEGCTPELFEMILNLRSQRHKVERQIIEEKQQLELLRKDLDLSNKNLRSIENAHQKCDEDLSRMQMEKQKQLNDLDVAAVLNLSQIQQITSTTDLGAISKYVLFSKEKLDKLHFRTKELEDESENQIEKHRLLQKHLHRLNVDCKYMKVRITKLQEELNLQMEKKFGKVVDLMKLQQAILHKYLLEFQNQLQEMKGVYEQGYADWQHQLHMKQNKMTEVTAANTEKISLLAALQEEKTKLDKILKHQHELSKSSFEAKMDLYESDVTKLVKIKKRQQRQKESLKEEIMKLSRKTRHGSLPPLEFSKPSNKYKDDEDFMADDLFTFKTETSGEVRFEEDKGYSDAESSEDA